MDEGKDAATAAPSVEKAGDVLRLTGALTTGTAAPLWDRTLSEARQARRIDLSGLTALDTTGATLVLRAAAAGEGSGEPAGPDAAPGTTGGIPIEGADDRVAAVLERARSALAGPAPASGARRLPLVAALGAWGVGRWKAILAGIAFVGETAATLVNAARSPRDVRIAELFRHLDEVGTRSFGLVVLLGVLIGLILAFQSSIPMRQFGAEIFIPRLVGISLLRELGPLLAGVILAGRTGSAFAAELGTMTVNEEIDALRIMGIDPMVMLVLPRLLAATLAMPVMALLMNIAGLAGMTGVMLSIGYPLVMVTNQLQAGMGIGDLAQGLVKAAVFGLAIAGIGCRAGLQAGRGPRAVGDAATQAVVGGIVAIVVLDGIFAVLIYRLGI
ncbi:ABC transporter permease [Roseomonas sp. OT10]|uniref:ABC transporter permease n=1 Tax=Roseomonas cutis TaxID=2897332 RepID=UPI001E422DD6|nr:ABC transporter permease [Roseomonas sp. OT10]UFN50990.1 ABC transporter permease [Roseomonas sp. OT10]